MVKLLDKDTSASRVDARDDPDERGVYTLALYMHPDTLRSQTASAGTFFVPSSRERQVRLTEESNVVREKAS
jgi:hypothetical protein